MAVNVKPQEYRLVDIDLEGNRKIRVLIYHSMCDRYVRALSNSLALQDITGDSLSLEPLDEVDVLLAWKFPPRMLASLPNLKWVQTTTAGIDHVLDYYRSHPDLIVTTTKGLHAESVSSFVLLAILGFHWGLPLLLDRQRKRVWQTSGMPEVVSRSTCAIIGLGNIGRKVASHAKHLGMTVIGMKRQHMDAVRHVDQLYEQGEGHEMLARADFVVLALPLTEATRGMFGDAEFRAMKRSAYLINVARGGIVDEGALLSALRSSTIAGAAVDVFGEEPLPSDHPLWDSPNLIITPHVAGDRSDYVDGATSIFVENLMAFPDRSRMQGIASSSEGY